jgi:DNA-binding MarR family transcriptional regulator/N-acetylglutamate synthase-like GNAT family acetyltransferase
MASASRTSSLPHVSEIRRFNRFYTRQIGVLQEGLLSSPFSLTEVRVLYEIAHDKKITAVALCRELGLDAGYVSRILRSFEKRGLIARIRSTSDGRQQFLSLTTKGRKIFAPLEARSNEQVAAMLEKVPRSRQKQFIHAMHTIESAINPDASRNDGGGYILRAHQPGDMGWVVHRHGALYWKEYGYDERFEALVAQIVSEFIQNFDSKRERCWIAEKEGEIVGSVFVVSKSKTVAKLRLLLVEPTARGFGLGRRLVQECVRFARQAGYKKMMLWTQSELGAARHLYQEAGFELVAKQPHKSWGRKGMVAETWAMRL